jgi:hypothetical protein
MLSVISCHDTELHFCKIITGIYVGEGMVINFIFSYCKTGLRVTAKDSSVGGSGQATSIMAGFKSAVWSAIPIVVSPYGGLTFNCGSFFWKRMSSDIGYRSGVTKVPVEKLSEMAKAEN